MVTVVFWGDTQNRVLTFSYCYSLWRGIICFVRVFFFVFFFRFGRRWGWVGIKCFTHGKWDEASEEGYAV